jgi:hypothetical protein
LTQSNASFNFSAAYEAPDQTINQPWTSVVLEGLRRMDEGIKPRDPGSEQSEHVAQQATVASPEALVAPPLVDQPPVIQSKAEFSQGTVEPPAEVHSKSVAPVQVVPQPPAVHTKSSEAVAGKEVISKRKDEVVVDKPKQPVQRPAVSEAFLSSTQSASKFSSGPWKFAAVFAALVLIIAGIAVPWGLRVRGKAAKAVDQPAPALNEAVAQPQTSESTEVSQATSTSDVPANEETTPVNVEAADPARREREARAREEARLRARAAGTTEAATTGPAQPAPGSSSASAAPPASGPKKAVVQVTYDENGRVTGASGNDPTALRIARQRRFPPGKAGSATLTIPIN